MADLPMNPEPNRSEWTLTGGLQLVTDTMLGREVLTREKKTPATIRSTVPVNGPFEVTALVRMASEEASSVVLACGADGENPSKALCALTVSANPATAARTLTVTPRYGSLGSAALLKPDDLLRDGGVKIRLPNSVLFAPRYASISPVLEADFRQELEASMSRIPAVGDVWFQLRIVYRPECLQFFKDGFLIGERMPAGRLDGEVLLQLTGDVRVGAFQVTRPVPFPEGFYPLGLDNQCNARLLSPKTLPASTRDTMLDPASLPAGGAGGMIAPATSAQAPAKTSAARGAVPFIFPARWNGEDHVDVGQSLFHYRQHTGQAMATLTWPAPQALDPARLRFSVPNRPYRKLWLVAAADTSDTTVPLVTARFYRNGAGFPKDAAATVPAFTARSEVANARRLPVKRADGKEASLWLISIALDEVAIGSDFREEPTLSLELTKEVHPFRTYPDPSNYSWFQGGLPSSVRIFAMTLEDAPLQLIASGNRPGNAYMRPEEPVWRVNLSNLRSQRVDASIQVHITDPEGRTKTLQRSASLQPLAQASLEIPVPTTLLGLHSVRTEVRTNGVPEVSELAQTGTFVIVPPDHRNGLVQVVGGGARLDAKGDIVKDAKGQPLPDNFPAPRWGLWNWMGGHGTDPEEAHNLYLNRLAGARYIRTKDSASKRTWNMTGTPQHLLYGPEPWASKDPVDPAAYAEFKERIGRKAAEMYAKDPNTVSFSIFTETSITQQLTYGVPPEYTGEDELVLSNAEQTRYRAFMVTARAACEGIREHAPKAKIALGWCETIFAIPFMKEKFPRELFDFFGIDSPQFERMPEMPVREIAPGRMWMLKQAMKKYGYADVPVIHTESYYPTSHELGLGHRGSADSIVRTAVLAFSQGTTNFANCWSLHDCSNYWGSQHYGCIGLIGRRPEYNPKPAFPAFATMTRLLDSHVSPDGFVPTGSLSVYCVRFAGKTPKSFVYSLWTLRGKRTAKLVFAKNAKPFSVDENSNTSPLRLVENTGELLLGASPVWVTSEQPIERIELGEPAYNETPGRYMHALDTFASPWTFEPAGDERYAKSHWGAPRFAAQMTSETVDSPERKSKVWQVTLHKPEKQRPLAAWYGAFAPDKTLEIPGKARSLGVWINGKSNWGRIACELEDAKGEIWLSTGTKDDWNCDDTHCWSYFNFDGWRFVEFPLPATQPADNYREKDTVWWGSYGGDGVVDLPLKLRRVMIEHRTHHVYVDQLLEVPDSSVQFSNLVAIYDNPNQMTSAPVDLQKRAANVVRFQSDASSLPNPHADFTSKHILPAPVITKINPPEHQYDGTRVEVSLEPVADAKEYRVYVSAYENGAGAQSLGTLTAQKSSSAAPVVLVSRLRPETPLYLFATYVDSANKESKPTAIRRVLLKDDFPMK